jgi:hypothetical protein
MEFRDFFKRRRDRSGAEQKRWSKPRAKFLKINVDASFREENMTGGWGFVVRNMLSSSEICCWTRYDGLRTGIRLLKSKECPPVG